MPKGRSNPDLMGETGQLKKSISWEAAEIQDVVSFSQEVNHRDSDEFEIEIRRNTDGIGLEFESVGDSLLVAKVRRGAVKCWNEAYTDEPHLMVNPGDRILSVNGNEGSSTELLAELKKDQTMSIVLKRAKSFQVKIVKDNKELGICLLSGAEKLDQLQVKTLRAGVVDDWNKTHPTCAIGIGDRIVWVNGISADPTSMLDELKVKNVLDMTIIRPS